MSKRPKEREVVREWSKGRMRGKEFAGGYKEKEYIEPNQFGGKKPSVSGHYRVGVEELTRQYLAERKDEMYTLEKLYYAIGAEKKMSFREYKKRMNWVIWKRVVLKEKYWEEGSGLSRTKSKVIQETRGVFQVLQDASGLMYLADKNFDLEKLEV